MRFQNQNTRKIRNTRVIKLYYVTIAHWIMQLITTLITRTVRKIACIAQHE